MGERMVTDSPRGAAGGNGHARTSTCPPASATTFRHRVAAHAASGALRDLLEHHRLSYAPEPLSEGAIFGLSGAFSLRTRIAQHALPAIDIDGRAHSLEADLARHLRLKATWCLTEDPHEAWRRLREELDAGRPALVRADIAELGYRDGRHHDTRHAIVVTGYDRRAGIVWVADGSFPEPRRCTVGELARARTSMAYPEPARHAMLRLRGPQRLATPYEAVAAAIRRTVDNMRTPPEFEHPHVRTGLGAVDALADAWPRLPQMTGDRLGQTLGALRFRVRDAGTGGALYRSLQARFLHDAAALLGSRRLGQAALVCDDLADAWRAVASSLEIEDAAVAHEVAAPWIERIRSLEHRHLETLEAHLRLRSCAAA
ncbi:MAG TPA: DUF4872 domain-containing protein [Solirubrobacteraceae bacterium]|nr:DUF4872 domain-containing protein [Solirubrobacteraceae bacterium]